MVDKTDNPSGSVLVTAVTDWLMQQALGQASLEDVFDGCCQRLDAAGLPISRAMVTFRTLHPLYASTIMFWRRGEDVRSSRTRHEDAFSSEEFTNSPIHRLLTTSTPFLRRRLAGDTALLDFPVLEDLSEQGLTDYLAYKVALSSNIQADRYDNAIVGSWATTRPGGFTDSELVWLMRVQSRLAVTCKMQIQAGVTTNLLDAYLGPNASDRVLGGQVRHGDNERIETVIWYSDMRDSTAWGDRLDPDTYLRLINSYFECTAGSVIALGGEVLRFIGDGVLALFPVVHQRPSGAAENAMKAVHEAQQRLASLNATRHNDQLDPIDFGIGLHVGELTFGNIGVAERLEFSVVGPAANEVARLESMTKSLNTRVVASEDFARLVDIDWQCEGQYDVRGVGGPMQVFSPADTK